MVVVVVVVCFFFLIAGCNGSLGYWQSLATSESNTQHQWYCVPKESQVPTHYDLSHHNLCMTGRRSSMLCCFPLSPSFLSSNMFLSFVLLCSALLLSSLLSSFPLFCFVAFLYLVPLLCSLSFLLCCFRLFCFVRFPCSVLSSGLLCSSALLVL